MFKSIKAIAVASIFAASTAAHAVISSATPIPDTFVLTNFNGTGLDWVYAGPVGPTEWSAFAIAPASYRAGEGWRAATSAEWALHPQWNDFIVAGNPGNLNAGNIYNSLTDHSIYTFASEYWSDFTHVDPAQWASSGSVTDGVNNPQFIGGVPETIYVRTSISAVPEPLPMVLVASGLVVTLLSRRTKRAAANS